MLSSTIHQQGIAGAVSSSRAVPLLPNHVLLTIRSYLLPVEADIMARTCKRVRGVLLHTLAPGDSYPAAECQAAMELDHWLSVQGRGRAFVASMAPTSLRDAPPTTRQQQLEYPLHTFAPLSNPKSVIRRAVLQLIVASSPPVTDFCSGGGSSSPSVATTSTGGPTPSAVGSVVVSSGGKDESSDEEVVLLPGMELNLSNGRDGASRHGRGSSSTEEDVVWGSYLPGGCRTHTLLPVVSDDRHATTTFGPVRWIGKWSRCTRVRPMHPKVGLRIRTNRFFGVGTIAYEPKVATATATPTPKSSTPPPNDDNNAALHDRGYSPLPSGGGGATPYPEARLVVVTLGSITRPSVRNVGEDGGASAMLVTLVFDAAAPFKLRDVFWKVDVGVSGEIHVLRSAAQDQPACEALLSSHPFSLYHLREVEPAVVHHYRNHPELLAEFKLYEGKAGLVPMPLVGPLCFMQATHTLCKLDFLEHLVNLLHEQVLMQDESELLVAKVSGCVSGLLEEVSIALGKRQERVFTCEEVIEDLTTPKGLWRCSRGVGRLTRADPVSLWNRRRGQFTNQLERRLLKLQRMARSGASKCSGVGPLVIDSCFPRSLLSIDLSTYLADDPI